MMVMLCLIIKCSAYISLVEKLLKIREDKAILTIKTSPTTNLQMVLDILLFYQIHIESYPLILSTGFNLLIFFQTGCSFFSTL